MRRKISKGGGFYGTCHDHTHQTNKKVLMISFIIIFGFMIVEIIGGLLTNSLALCQMQAIC